MKGMSAPKASLTAWSNLIWFLLLFIFFLFLIFSNNLCFCIAALQEEEMCIISHSIYTFKDCTYVGIFFHHLETKKFYVITQDLNYCVKTVKVFKKDKNLPSLSIFQITIVQ